MVENCSVEKPLELGVGLVLSPIGGLEGPRSRDPKVSKLSVNSVKAPDCGVHELRGWSGVVFSHHTSP